jgi:hypothetical protein
VCSGSERPGKRIRPAAPELGGDGVVTTPRGHAARDLGLTVYLSLFQGKSLDNPLIYGRWSTSPPELQKQDLFHPKLPKTRQLTPYGGFAIWFCTPGVHAGDSDTVAVLPTRQL